MSDPNRWTETHERVELTGNAYFATTFFNNSTETGKITLSTGEHTITVRVSREGIERISNALYSLKWELDEAKIPDPPKPLHGVDTFDPDDIPF